MEQKKATMNSTVQELRAVFAKSQLNASLRTSQESLGSLIEPSGIADPENIEKDLDVVQPEDIHKQATSQNPPARKPLSRPSIGPKPTVPSQGSNTGIRNLVAALEGTHGMYTSKNMHGKRGITVKNLRENVENSKLVDKDIRVTSTLIKKERVTLCEGKNEKDDSPQSKVQCQVIQCEHLISVGKDANVSGSVGDDRTVGENTLRSQVLTESSVETKSNRASQSVISVDNYVCKRRVGWVRRPLPSRESLGPEPSKPARPEGMRLPLQERNYLADNYSISSSSGDSLPPPVPDRNLNNFIKPPSRVPPKPPRSPPKPSPKLPPADIVRLEPSSTLDETTNLSQEEEIYNDIIVRIEPATPLKHSTPVDDEDDDLYDDHSPENLPPSLPKNPPPLPPISSSQSDLLAASSSSFNQDSSEAEDADNIYEEAQLGPEYVNTEDVNKVKKKLKKKNLKLEQKNLEKIEKKREKFMKMFSLSGEEIPLDAGIVKNDCRGSKYDLNVFQGETVLVLRMENNPSGKWLVKNGKGKIGYVELTNIEVDVESVKSVMTVRGSQIYGEEVLSIPQAEVSGGNESLTC